MRVVLIAYHFPPVGGPGVQRAVGLARHLPAHGVDVAVVTGPGAADGRWTPRDATLGLGLPAGLRVERVPGPAPAPADGGGVRRRLQRLGLAPVPFSRWWIRGASVLAARVAREERADLILATMSPFETSWAAAAAAREAGVPWAADLRDPWALDEMTVYPTAAHRAWAVRRMRDALSSAALVVMNTRAAAEAVRRAMPGVGPVEWVTNGYEAADFAPAPAGAAVQDEDDGALRVVHTGFLHTDLGRSHRDRPLGRRGGERVPVDILARSHVPLLAALRGMPAHERAAVEVHLAGRLSAADRDAVRRSGVADRVVCHGHLDHAASVALVRSAGLLYLPMHRLPAGEPALIVPGKLYEYLASGRPVLAAVPEGDARDLVVASGAGVVVPAGDAAAIRGALRDRLRGAPLPRRREDLVAGYRRDRLAERMAGLLRRAA